MQANEKYYVDLVKNLCKLPNETEWLEFKVNNFEKDMIGEDISALSNSATICEKEKAYMIWGVDDKTHKIVGTDFNPKSFKIGNEELENWLLRLLNPRIDFSFIEVFFNHLKVVILEIPSSNTRPTSFKNIEYVRVGSYKKRLNDFPEKERKLWLSFEKKPYELRIVSENFTAAQITELLDCAYYYTLNNMPLPSSRAEIIYNMIDEDFIVEMDNGNYAITNMGALLFAKDLNDFPSLKRKVIRVIKYKGNGKTNAIREQIFLKGYAIQFESITDYIMSLLPQGEEIDGGLREDHVMFPRNAVREMLGNIIIHQDLTTHGDGPMMEIFDTKIEASNPGSLLVEIDRIIDTVPHSRNENMASFLRRIGVCEERGSGFDRIEEGMSELKIPATKVETGDNFTRTKLYWYGDLSEWTKEDRIRTCYYYTCYCYVNDIEVSNTTLRERFGVSNNQKSLISKIISQSIQAGYLKLQDEKAAVKMRRYVPYWA